MRNEHIVVNYGYMCAVHNVPHQRGVMVLSPPEAKDVLDENICTADWEHGVRTRLYGDLRLEVNKAIRPTKERLGKK